MRIDLQIIEELCRICEAQNRIIKEQAMGITCGRKGKEK